MPVSDPFVALNFLMGQVTSLKLNPNQYAVWHHVVCNL